MGYLNSTYFKDLYLYLAQNTLPSSKSTTRKDEILAERYILQDSLLFRLNTSPDKEKALLAIPTDRLHTRVMGLVNKQYQHT